MKRMHTVIPLDSRWRAGEGKIGRGKGRCPIHLAGLLEKGDKRITPARQIKPSIIWVGVAQFVTQDSVRLIRRAAWQIHGSALTRGTRNTKKIETSNHVRARHEVTKTHAHTRQGCCGIFEQDRSLGKRLYVYDFSNRGLLHKYVITICTMGVLVLRITLTIFVQLTLSFRIEKNQFSLVVVLENDEDRH